MTKNRSLEVIAAEIHTEQRSGVIAVGKLLIEARNTCEHGKWLRWLEDEFRMSATHADRLMGCATLAGEFPKLAKLNLAKSTLYDLLEYGTDEQETVISALAKHAMRKPLKPAAAKQIMDRAVLAQKYGALPTETLRAIDDLLQWSEAPWIESATQTLRAEKPKTVAAANEICRVAAQSHMDGICGKLPDLPYDALDRLSAVSDDDRPAVVAMILAAPDTVQSGADISCLEMRAHRLSGEHNSPDDDDPSDDAPSKPERGLAPDLFHALHTLQAYAREALPTAVKEFTVQELAEIEKFVRSLREIAQLEVAETVGKGEREAYYARIKDAADRAEARSRQTASGKAVRP